MRTFLTGVLTASLLLAPAWADRKDASPPSPPPPLVRADQFVQALEIADAVSEQNSSAPVELSPEAIQAKIDAVMESLKKLFTR